jgi:hypothetical protein
METVFQYEQNAAECRQSGADDGPETEMRKENHKFVASCEGGDAEAHFVLLATGLI